MNVQELMRKYKSRIDRELAIFFEERMKRVNGMNTAAVEAFEVLKEFNLRESKRIRPLLTIFSYKGFGGKKERSIIKAALAVELMQSFLLIHDDIIDRDEMRRGYFTVHKIYENKSRKKYKLERPEHYGSSLGIVIGDIASVLGSEAIISTDFPAKRKLQAVDKFNRVVINTCFGQILDINSEIEQEITEKDIHDIHTLKTAIYTTEGPLHIGAILAGAKAKQLKQLSRFSIPLGKAFQIKDDILGMYGSREKIGKPIGSDIREGKRTLLIVKALEKANALQRACIEKCLGKKDLTMLELEAVRKIVKDSGSLDYSLGLADRYVLESKRILARIRMKKEGKKFLSDIADYMVKRDK